MVCVKVCVVFMLVANISGHVIKSNQKDLESALKAHYDFVALTNPMNHDSHSNLQTASNQHNTEEEQENSSRRVSRMSYKDFSGPPLQFYNNMEIKDDKTRERLRQAAIKDIPQDVLDSIFSKSIQEPVGESSAPPLKAVNEKDSIKRKNKPDIDLNVLKAIWNSPSDGPNNAVNTLMIKIDTANISSSLDVPMVPVNESALAANSSGSTITNEDRFLSEKALRDSYLNNVDNGEKPATAATSRHAMMSALGNPINTSTNLNLSKLIAIATLISVLLFK